MALRTAHFESEYAKISGRTIQMLDAEKSRVKLMEQLLLQFENDTLRLELEKINEQLVEVIQTDSDARFQLYEARREMDCLHGIVKSSSHEVQNLRVGDTLRRQTS